MSPRTRAARTGAGRTSAARTRARGSDAAMVLVAFTILLVCIPSQLAVKELGGWATPAMVLAFGLMAWWCAGRLVPSLGLERRTNPLRVAVGLFGCSLLASYAIGFLHPLSGLNARSADRSMLFGAGLIGVALITMDGIRSRRRLDLLIKCIVAVCAFSAFLGLLSFFFGLYPLNHLHIPGLSAQLDSNLSFVGQRSKFRRVAGTARHPIEFGVMMAVAFPLALTLAFNTPKPTNRRWWICFLMIASVLPMSLSRSAILGVVCASAVLWTSWPRQRRIRALIITPVYLGIMRLVIPGLLGTLRNLFTHAGQDNSISHRTDNYKRIGSIVRHQFFFGSGFGTYIPTRNEYVLDNAYLGHLIETGVVGLTLLLTMFFMGYFCARGARRRSVDPYFRDQAQALAAAMAVVIPGFFTFDAFGFPMAVGLVFLVLGCCGAAWRLARNEQEAREWAGLPTSAELTRLTPV